MTVSLDIYSDPICPWCYIGKRRLDRAEAEAGRVFERRWRVFQLNPDMPRGGMDRRAYLERKFGGPDGAARVYGAIERTARADGLEVRFDLIGRTPNTTDAHRVIRWAEASDGQDAVMEALFHAYFEAGEDISDIDVLVGAGENGGLEPALTRRLLNGDVDRGEVAAEEAAARAAGVSGAPTFLVNEKHVVQGAQETALWVNVISEIKDQLDGATSQKK